MVTSVTLDQQEISYAQLELAPVLVIIRYYCKVNRQVSTGRTLLGNENYPNVKLFEQLRCIRGYKHRNLGFVMVFDSFYCDIE